MDVFNDDLRAFKEWMEKLQEQSYYKTLTEAHVESAEGVDFDGAGAGFLLTRRDGAGFLLEWACMCTPYSIYSTMYVYIILVAM